MERFSGCDAGPAAARNWLSGNIGWMFTVYSTHDPIRSFWSTPCRRGFGAAVPYAARVAHDRYGSDVLTPGWQKTGKPASTELPLSRGLVVEDPTSGYVGAVLRWENGLVVLEDRKGRQRSFPLGAGFRYEGRPVTLI